MTQLKSCISYPKKGKKNFVFLAYLFIYLSYYFSTRTTPYSSFNCLLCSLLSTQVTAPTQQAEGIT